MLAFYIKSNLIKVFKIKIHPNITFTITYSNKMHVSNDINTDI